MTDSEENPRKRLCEDVSDQGTSSDAVALPEKTSGINNVEQLCPLPSDAPQPLDGIVEENENVKIEEKMAVEPEYVSTEQVVGVQGESVVEMVVEKEPEGGRGKKRKLESRNDDNDEEAGDGNAPCKETKCKDLPVEEDMKVSLEEDVGITEFMSCHSGFSGTIKQRYSDFIVNEVDIDGNVVHLTDLSLPSEMNNPQDDSEASNGSSGLLSEENVKQLKDILESKSQTDEVLIPAGSDKAARTLLHQTIKAQFPDLDSNTIEKNGEKFVQIKYLVRKDKRKSTIWKKNTGNYIKFVLYKENKDTLEAINLFSKFLRVSSGCFAFAGTKDRRAKTSQEVTAYRIEPSRLHRLNSSLRNIRLGNFRFCKEPLKLGELLGNRFVILLRNVLGSDEEIEKGLCSLRDFGFINYYGMQRFGTTRIPTHHVGKALLCGKWSDAVDLILKPREGDRDEISKARAIWWSTRDPQKALQELRSQHCMEKNLLEGLKKYSKNDFVSALKHIPINMRLMYIHAYQSYLWNRVVSRRIRQLGLRPVVGDLALRGNIKNLEEESLDGDEENKKSSRLEPIEVTEQNLSEFALTDIVLPLPGFDVRYPKNEIQSWYNEILKEDGMENFDFKHKVRDYSLPGGYRKIVIKPDQMTWDIMYYTDHQVSLFQSDLEVINQEQLPPRLSEGKFKAVKLELSLPSSCYATMALREVLKCGTSAAYHTSLNVV